jgi:hypothetical protein
MMIKHVISIKFIRVLLIASVGRMPLKPRIQGEIECRLGLPFAEGDRFSTLEVMNEEKACPDL